jgi:uncharacterized hydrophobic protein (TIGR00271 family)
MAYLYKQSHYLNINNIKALTNIFDKFKLNAEKEDLRTVVENIDAGVVFRGTNLWVLIFAIFVASLGLNVNSTAVIIGAMLISPLMGPIMGIGLGMGINDLALLRKAIFNYSVATGVALATSTLFFLLSPLDDAHSEILARTSPNIYDVLIALFGGFAGILATSSKQKGNVIPGVAIATALMPPLCTAGYGIATLQFNYFVGAFYLFIINTVFIALATLIMVRLLHFPHKHLQTKKADIVAQRITWLVVLATLLPSLYFGYDMIEQDRFAKNANRFIVEEAHFQNDYLLNKKIDAKNKKLTLIFGGKEIDSADIVRLRAKLKHYDLPGAKLEVQQGFAYLTESKATNQTDQLAMALLVDKALKQLREDSINNEALNAQVFAELKTQYPSLKAAAFQPTMVHKDSAVSDPVFFVMLTLLPDISKQEKTKIERWLKVRLQQKNIKLFFE